jgi:hypothetical protein
MFIQVGASPMADNSAETPIALAGTEHCCLSQNHRSLQMDDRLGLSGVYSFRSAPSVWLIIQLKFQLLQRAQSIASPRRIRSACKGLTDWISWRYVRSSLRMRRPEIQLIFQVAHSRHRASPPPPNLGNLQRMENYPYLEIQGFKSYPELGT